NAIWFHSLLLFFAAEHAFEHVDRFIDGYFLFLLLLIWIVIFATSTWILNCTTYSFSIFHFYLKIFYCIQQGFFSTFDVFIHRFFWTNANDIRFAKNQFHVDNLFG